MEPAIETDEQPLRYFAFEHPGKVVALKDPERTLAGCAARMYFTTQYAVTLVRYQEHAWTVEVYDRASGSGPDSDVLKWDEALAQFNQRVQAQAA